MRRLVEDRALVGFLEFDDPPVLLIEYVPRVERKDRCVGFGLRRQPFEIITLASRVTGMLDEGLELLALERLGVTSIRVFDDDPLLLDVSDAEAPRRQRCDQRGVLREVLTALDQRSPRRSERRSHIHPSRVDA